MRNPLDTSDANINACRNRLRTGKYKFDEKGTWKIEGECICDFSGSPHLPTLKYVEGFYSYVVEFALKLPSFFVWGSGGEITKIEIEKI